MGLDTEFRPTRYADVAGQEATKVMLCHIVRSGAGLSQSYLFGGPWGSGKTTLARILARALLCYQPAAGEPCDACESCLAMLSSRGSPDFIEIDAATQSSKADVVAMLENLQYDEHTGRRRIYLYDEAHALSKEAEDALLKAMEDERPGCPREKRLVVIFCTTEPENMRPTILSRCAPPFRVRSPGYQAIADRLAYVCRTKQIEADPAALLLVARATGGHFRDALKAVEAVSTAGAVDRAAVAAYLGSDVGEDLCDLLLNLSDLPSIGRRVDALLDKISPSTAYRYVADFCIAAFQVHAGGEVPEVAWDESALRRASSLGVSLLALADRFGSRPSRVSRATLYCDLALGLGGEVQVGQVAAAPALPPRPAADPGKKSADFYFHPKAQPAAAPASRVSAPEPARMDPALFAGQLRDRIAVLRSAS